MGLPKKKVTPIGVPKPKTLEEVQQVEEQKSKQRVEMSQKELRKAERKEFIRTFTRPQHFLTALTVAGASALYLYMTTDTVLASIIISLIGGVLFSFYYSFLEKKLEAKQKDLATLESYCLDISFHMQTGKTVGQTLKKVAESYTGKVGADIKHTYAMLKNTGELDFTHFDKYEFTALNIFHRNMLIAYQDGGDAKRLFKRPLKNMSTELVKRDELYRKNRFQRRQENVALTIALLIPLIMRLMVGDLYADFTSMPMVALATIGLCYFGCMIISFMVQRRALDISVRSY
ncbi:hypothetical protein [Bacillus thuringiensis]|uniref:hypothetical protein n=1 Tax=Bacillus thuringiensis TaxID=1428 RepID=UPI000BFC1F6C|nr:hypothetical protein [Bacillus thuringiensis]PGT89977.1 hypothetical protein COD17_09515 [Bacillus thuringiensis]